MAEAMLVRKGGAVLRDLTLISPPDKLAYYQGDYLDMDGTIVGARFGTFTIPLHETAWSYSPTRALVDTDTAILISATIGRVTKTYSIPITVEDFSTVLNNNSWTRIAYAAASGIAKNLWNVGDAKYFTLNGTQIEARIIAFDADPLNSSDEKYNDTSYNGNKKKAAIAFQFFTSPGKARMHNYNTEVGWDDCEMRTVTFVNLYNNLPSDLKSVIRLVNKYSHNGYQGRDITTADRLFLESEYEVRQSPTSYGGRGIEQTKRILYTYYANGNAPIHSAENWIRTMDGNGCTVRNHFFRIKTDGTTYTGSNYNTPYDYFPMFCI